VPPVDTGTALPPPAPIAVSPEATQHAKSVAGTEAKQATKKYVFDPTEEAAVNQRVRDKAQAAGEQAYDAAIAAGKNEKQAKKDANKAVQQTAKAEAKAEAQRAAHAAAQRAISDGTAFDTSKLDADTQAQLNTFQTGPFAAQRLGPALAGKNNADFLAFMGQEVSAGTVPPPRTINIAGPPPQSMQMWEYPDGTVVRHKPLGDSERPNPTYSIEVKKDPSQPDSGKDDAAFKVDASGRAVPKGPHEVANPYPKNTNQDQHEAFLDALMNAGHSSLTP
jgi:hypothetical protein